jgi:hypothetical protein
MTVCYFIQSHRDPSQVVRLARTIKLSSPYCQVLISHDYSSSYLDRDLLADLAGVHVIARSRKAERGRFSIFQVFLDALDWLFENGVSFDWLVYLSGQDYPVQPLGEVEQFLAETEHDGFMQYWNAVEHDRNPWGGANGRNRYYFRYYHLPRGIHGLVRRSAGVLGKLGRPLPLRFSGRMLGLAPRWIPFNEDFTCYGGFIWCTLSRPCLDYLRRYLRENPKLVEHYRRTLFPEESLLASVLLNSRQFSLCNDSKRYVEFRKSWGRVLADVDFGTITNSEYHFARKFDSTENEDLLALLDARVVHPVGQR